MMKLNKIIIFITIYLLIFFKVSKEEIKNESNSSINCINIKRIDTNQTLCGLLKLNLFKSKLNEKGLDMKMFMLYLLFLNNHISIEMIDEDVLKSEFITNNVINEKFSQMSNITDFEEKWENFNKELKDEILRTKIQEKKEQLKNHVNERIKVYSTSRQISIREDHDHHHHHDHSTINLDTIARNNLGIFFAFIAWFVVTIFGFLGFILIPLKKHHNFYVFTLQLLTAIGFGSLTGDAIFHLLPHSIEFHHHHNNSSHDGHSNEELLKLVTLVFGIISLYFVEIIIKVCPFTRNRSCGCHSSPERKKSPEVEVVVHSCDSDDHEHRHGDHDCINVEAIHDLKRTSATHRLGAGVPNEIIAATNKPAVTPCLGEDNVIDPKNGQVTIVTSLAGGCSNVKEARSVVLVLLLSDIFHHILDGLAIGANFSSAIPGSYQSGISTALAILFHELPHKFGDMVLLVRSGYSEKKATIYVVAASSISLIGVIIGCFASKGIESSVIWINLFTAGMFIYIALVLMMSQMISAISNPEISICLIIIAHTLGIFIGFLIMILIAKFESHM